MSALPQEVLLIDETYIYSTLLARLDSVINSIVGVDYFVDGGPQVNLQAQKRPFVQVSVEVESVRKKSIERGKGVQRFEGHIVFGIMVPAASGTKLANTIRADLRDAFTSLYIGHVQMGDSHSLPSLKRIPEWYGIGMMCLFTVDKLPA